MVVNGLIEHLKWWWMDRHIYCLLSNGSYCSWESSMGDWQINRWVTHHTIGSEKINTGWSSLPCWGCRGGQLNWSITRLTLLFASIVNGMRNDWTHLWHVSLACLKTPQETLISSRFEPSSSPSSYWLRLQATHDKQYPMCYLFKCIYIDFTMCGI